MLSQKKKKPSKLEYQDDSIGCRKKNSPTDLWAERDDDSACYIVCDVVSYIVYDISLHIVYYIIRTYDIVYKDEISCTISYTLSYTIPAVKFSRPFCLGNDDRRC